MKEIGIYIHIPFCKRKCFYCDFCSFVKDEGAYFEYVKSLIMEIDDYKNKLYCIDQSFDEEYLVKTIYIGGGTPSIISSDYIEDIINIIRQKFVVAESAEITLELNPGTANKEKLRKYKSLGVNRLSIGLQSTDNEILKKIGRIHTYEEFESVYEDAKHVGFSNINVDLMIGLPTQTVKDVEDSVKKIVKKNPKHISIYSLILEEDTVLYNLIDNKQLVLPDEDSERKMYWIAKKILEENGYKQYEISNFSKEGFESKHNTDCWEQKEYIGFGLAAHSYISGRRFSNKCDFDEYINNCKETKFQNNIVIHEIQDETSKMNEYVILKLRMLEGINFKKFQDIFGVNFKEQYSKSLTKLLNMELICEKDGFIRLTEKGIDFANIVWEEFC